MIIRRVHLVALLLAVLVPTVALGGSSNARGAHDKLDRALQKALAKGRSVQQVIVTAQPGQEAVVRALLLSSKATIRRQHGRIGAFSAEVDTSALESLAASDAVTSISVNATVAAFPNSHGGSRQAEVDTLRATLGLNPQSITGVGVTVAVIDSGIADISEFSGRLVAFYDCTTGSCVPARAYDDYGHGTHVAGLIAGNGTISNGQYQGVAPAARLVGLKVLDGNGQGRTDDVIEAIEAAIAHKDALGIDVINLSLGHPVFESATTDPLVKAVNAAVAEGIVVVCSAGNFGVNPTTEEVGYAGITSPANSRSALTIGALNTQDTVVRVDDTVAEYSSRGPTWIDAYAKPDLVAPGDRLVSVAPVRGKLYTDHPDLRVQPGKGFPFMRLSGTSMAAAVASGSVALVIDEYRHVRGPQARITPNAVKAILQFTALPVSGFDVLTQGTGGLNAAGAIYLASLVDFSGRVPLPNTVVTTTTDIGGRLEMWAQTIVWGDNIVWSDNVVWSDNIVWGENIVWGDNVIWGDNIAWTDNVVWSDNIVWADNIVWGDGLVGIANPDGSVTWDGAANVVWSDLDLDNVVWGDVDFDNVVWGDADLDNIIWADTIAALFGRK